MHGRRPEETAAAFDRAAKRAEARYAFIGGIAVAAWGQPRATQDVDCLLDLPPGNESRLASALATEGLSVRPADFLAARKDLSHVTVFDEHGPFHVDCKLVRTPEEREQVRDALRVDISTGEMWVARAEETIAFKLKFGSPQDLKDASSIVVRQAGKLDEARLLGFALRLGVLREVQDLLRPKA